MSIVLDYDYTPDPESTVERAKATVTLRMQLTAAHARSDDEGPSAIEQLKADCDHKFADMTFEELAADKCSLRELAAALSPERRAQLRELVGQPDPQPAPVPSAAQELPVEEVLAVTTEISAEVLVHRLAAMAAYRDGGALRAAQVYWDQVRQQIRELAATQPPDVRQRLEQLFRLGAEG